MVESEMHKHAISLRDTGVSVLEVLEMIADGMTYRHILLKRPQLTSADIMASARLACDILSECVTAENSIEISQKMVVRASGGRVLNLSKLREQHPRAYEPWNDQEEGLLLDLHGRGTRINEISKVLKRNVGAVKSRLQKLGEVV